MTNASGIGIDASGNPEGTWFWIQIGEESEGDYDHAYVLRLSLTEHATDDDLYPRWTIDGHEPNE